ncbi:MAG: DUF881 domain-containing protein [Frankiaceae bacterium]|jgi:uncharacterized protein YlxW (UPF0749 family)|nr:DUF881 domain-containing protein [Frankiaceae bacterium]
MRPAGTSLGAAGDLLHELLNNPLDAGYAQAARRRAQAGGPPGAAEGPSWTLRALTAGGALLVGILLAVAYRQEARQAPAQSGARALLIDQVLSARDQISQMRSSAAELSDEVRRLRESAAGADPALRAALASLEEWSGDRAVQGPGVTVTIADPSPASASPGATPARSGVPGSYPATQIGDRELREIVNALWGAGAEAISVNDIRISAVSAIRFAGQVVLIDFQPVTSPYEIKAIGNANAMDVAFLGSDLGARLSTQNSAGRIRFSARTAASLLVPANAQAAPVHASPDVPQKPSASPPSPEPSARSTSQPPADSPSAMEPPPSPSPGGTR